jgi:hypothetical protein
MRSAREAGRGRAQISRLIVAALEADDPQLVRVR